jgi:transcriptional regulator with XRE-family HTH domain
MFDPGQYFRLVRERNGYSLRDLERRSGYSRSYLAAIEKGARLPAPFALRCIAESMEMDKPTVDLLIDCKVRTC